MKQKMQDTRTDTRRRGYTLWELLLVVLIIMILSCALIPLMRGHVNDSKWTEGVTAAGMIQNAVRVYHSNTGIAIVGRLNNTLLQSALFLEDADLTGSFFVPGDYEIVSVNTEGKAEVRVTGSLLRAPSGSKILYPDGSWK